MRRLFNRDKPKLEEVSSDLTFANSSEQDVQDEWRRQGAPITEDQQSGQQDITMMIGYLTATSFEDWTVVLDLCERASATEANAKEAAKALRTEFKYGEAPYQLSAARLWAIMLRNSSELFVHQCAKSKFLDTLEDVLASQRTSPVVRDRLLDVLAAAAYASSGPSHKIESSFRLLWRKVKPAGKPDEGVPFDPDDAMFNPPSPRQSTATTLPSDYQLPRRLQFAPPPNTQPHELAQLLQSPQTRAPQQPNRAKRGAGQVQLIIPPEEDMRRLFQECRFAQGNAQLLSEALTFARPEDLREKDIIKEWYSKCLSSHDLVAAQIPWATAGADRSRAAREAQQQRTTSRPSGLGEPSVPRKPPRNKQGSGEESPVELTPEEQLLDSLREANEALTSVLRDYDDIERIGIEREEMERSRREIRLKREAMEHSQRETEAPVYDSDSRGLGRPAFSPGRASSPNGLPSKPTGPNGKSRHVPEEEDGGEDSAEYPTKSAVSDAASSEGEVARLERERLVELERQLSATLAAQTEQDRRMAQLADELALKSALLEKAEANERQLSATHAAQTEQDRRLAQLADELALKSALLEQAEANERQLSATRAAQTEQDRRLAQLADELTLKSALLEQAEEATKRTRLELSELSGRLLEKTSLVELKDASLVKMQAKLVELLLSRDQDLRALEQSQSALQKATSRAADADERSRRAREQIGHLETELAKVRVAGKSKPEAVSLQLADMDNGWTKNNTDGDTSPPLTPASLDSMDEDPIIRGLVERIRALEAEVAALRWNEKSSDVMNVNEG